MRRYERTKIKIKILQISEFRKSSVYDILKRCSESQNVKFILSQQNSFLHMSIATSSLGPDKSAMYSFAVNIEVEPMVTTSVNVKNGKFTLTARAKTNFETQELTHS
jgi:hypothetical protein